MSKAGIKAQKAVSAALDDAFQRARRVVGRGPLHAAGPGGPLARVPARAAEERPRGLGQPGVHELAMSAL